jgi:cell wall-associated NlpC family hydrolase
MTQPAYSFEGARGWKRHFFGLFLLGALVAGCSTDRDQKIADTLLSEARSQLAPDRTTTVFDVRAVVDNGRLLLTGEVQDAELKNRLVDFFRKNSAMTVEDQLTTLPDESVGDRAYGVVNVSVANLRVKPGHAQEMATQVLLGTPLKLLKRKGGWLYVQTPENYLGWTDDMITVLDQDGFEAWAARPKVIVTAAYGFTHSTRTPDAAIISDVVAGDILALVKKDGDHFNVEYPDGRTAILPKRDGEQYDRWLSNAKDTPERILRTARQFMGVPYLWGGTSAKALDCSGFTKTVFYLNGVLLPRDASQQARIGRPIELDRSYSNLLPGDLVFFGSRGNGDKPDRVTHVGIYIADKQFIHESGDVRVNSFDPSAADYSEYRTNTLLSARRIIGAGEREGVRRLVNIPYFKGHEL